MATDAPAPVNDLHDRWGQALAELRLRMSQATFDTWLRGSYPLRLDDGALLTVYVRHAYAVDWLQHRLQTLIEGAVERAFGQRLAVEFTAVRPADAVGAGFKPATIDPPEEIMEAVREERVTVREDGAPLAWTDFYIKLKVAFRRRALRELKGAPLSTFLCLALHVDRDGVAYPGIQTIMKETGYSRSVVCNALAELVRLGLVTKRSAQRGTDEYVLNGYAWFGQQPAPAFWEERS